MNRTAGIVPVVLATSAAAQTGNALFFNFPNGNVYSGFSPVVVEVWVRLIPFQYFAWAGWTGAVNGDTSGSFASPVLANPVPPPGTNAGTPGMNVTGIVAGQLHFPPVIFANTANPILVWSAEWSSASLAKRTVGIATDSEKLSVYSTTTSPNLTSFDEAFGVIQVVPTPAGTLLPACWMFAITHRRTRR